jgi:hypothetical protein
MTARHGSRPALDGIAEPRRMIDKRRVRNLPALAGVDVALRPVWFAAASNRG